MDRHVEMTWYPKRLSWRILPARYSLSTLFRCNRQPVNCVRNRAEDVAPGLRQNPSGNNEAMIHGANYSSYDRAWFHHE